MDDLISRAAALDVINTWGCQRSEKVRMGLLHRDMDAIPAVDAAPVVRCRECKHSIENAKHIDVACERSYDPDFYCAAGERRESE